MAKPQHGSSSGDANPPWEWKWNLIQRIARLSRVSDPTELQSVLIDHLAEIEYKARSGIRNTRAFMTRALWNKALNWIRDRKKEQEQWVSVEKPVGWNLDNPLRMEDVMAQLDKDPDHFLEIQGFIDSLAPNLLGAWLALRATGGNQIEAAGLLGIHRNTLHKLVRNIRQRFLAYESGSRSEPSAPQAKRKVGATPAPVSPRSVTMMRISFVERIIGLRLAGTAWRVLLWLIREGSRSKRALMPLSWARIAGALSLRRRVVRYTALALQKAKVLRLQAGKGRLQTQQRPPK